MQEPPTQIVIDLSRPPDDPGAVTEVPLTPEEIADRERVAADAARDTANATLTASAADEQLTLIHERADSDPAYAALARAMGVI